MSIRIVGAAHQALVAAAFAGSLVACTSAGPRSAADCGFRVASGSRLLGLMGVIGAFDRPAGPECEQRVIAGTFRFVPSAVVEAPPAPLQPVLPAPDISPRRLVPAGGGTFMMMP
jgi:hypothetical protein